MKKRIVLAGLSVMLCMLCGCLEATPLTDAEMDVVSEYAASLLLKYDKKYDTPLYYVEERELRLTPTPTPTPKPLRPTITSVPQQGSNNSTGSVSTATPTPTPALYNEAETSRQLTEIMGVESITVTCAGYELLKQSTEYSSRVGLVVEEGRQYAVVNFLLHNNTGEEVVFDASENGLEYSLDINTKTISSVSPSLLENDMLYMEIPVPANGTAEAVLVFEIAEEEINTIHLIIENESENTVFAKLK